MYASLLNHPNSLFGQFERLRRELDDVFGVSALPSSIRSVTPGTLPAINVGRTPNSVEVYAFAPGLDASKIDVSLDRGVLRIAAERASGIPADDPKVQIYTRERGSGSFTRAISLPDDVDPAQVNAKLPRRRAADQHRPARIGPTQAHHRAVTHPAFKEKPHERQQASDDLVCWRCCGGPGAGPTARRAACGRRVRGMLAASRCWLTCLACPRSSWS